MARAKRKKPYNPAKVHDRRSRGLLRNAEVAAVEVDDPLALEPGEKIVTLRSLRNDPLGNAGPEEMLSSTDLLREPVREEVRRESSDAGNDARQRPDQAAQDRKDHCSSS